MQNNVKQKSTLIKDAIALFLITLISGLALSYVYELTKAPIDEQKVLKQEKANKAVFVDADSFEKDDELTLLAADTDLTGLSSEYKGITIGDISKAIDGSGNVIGYDVSVTTKQSYKDSITLVFGYSMDGTIKGIQIMAISETAGLGMNANKPAFLDQYLNKKVDKFVVTKTGATTEDQIDAISGATITSKAVTNAVNAGISFITNAAPALTGGAQ
jgi:electron transport complex protein RnfG